MIFTTVAEWTTTEVSNFTSVGAFRGWRSHGGLENQVHLIEVERNDDVARHVPVPLERFNGASAWDNGC